MRRTITKYSVSQLSKSWDDNYIRTFDNVTKMFVFTFVVFGLDYNLSLDDVGFESKDLDDYYKSILRNQDDDVDYIRRRLDDLSGSEMFLFKHFVLRMEDFVIYKIQKMFKNFISLTIDERFNLTVGVNSILIKHERINKNVNETKVLQVPTILNSQT